MLLICSPIYFSEKLNVVRRKVKKHGGHMFLQSNLKTSSYGMPYGHFGVSYTTTQCQSDEYFSVEEVCLYAKTGHHKVVKAILSHKDIEPNPEWNDTTLLLIDAEAGNLEVVQELVKHPKIEPKKGHANGSTPLFVVSEKDYIEIV
jgi:hypothetical protein